MPRLDVFPATTSGQYVQISGQVVNISGMIVQISGQHVYIESGAHVIADIAESGIGVQIQSGIHVEQVDHLHSGLVDIQSGIYLASGQIVQISGQHVYVESGVQIAGAASISGNIVSISGILDISGSHVWISGQHVYVESGVYLASGCFVQATVSVNSGLGVLISGQHVYVESGVYLASGLYVNATVNVASGLGVLVSGQQTARSGHGAMYPFHTEIDDKVISRSGIYETDIVLNYGYFDTSNYWTPLLVNSAGELLVNIDGETIMISSGLMEIKSGIGTLISGQYVELQSGEIYLASGMHVVAAVSVNSGLGVLISGQYVELQSGEIYLASGMHTINRSLSGGVVTAIGWMYEPGAGGLIQLHASQLFAGGSVALLVDCVTISGPNIRVTSGAIGITSGAVIVSGSVQVSGAVVVSGIVGVSGQVSVLSGKVCVLSGEVEIATPTSVLINTTSGNPQVVGALSGGIILHSNEVISVIVKAISVNSGDLYIGGDTAGHRPYSGHGLVLEPGEAINLDIDNIGRVHAFAEVSGDLVNYIGVN